MQFIALLALLCLINTASTQVNLRWFNVPVDNYNPLLRQSFDLRYFVNSEHYAPGGPIFVYVGSGVDVYYDFIERGAMYEIAEETGGYLFSLEHRYFGESRPTDDTSVENLAYLNVNQAVADVGSFIAFVKENYHQARDAPVILWGRGYGGALAVWARHKFHHLVDGVWASSAPINAIVDSHEFMRNTGGTIRSIGGVECYRIIEDAFRMMEDAIRLRDTSYIEQRFRLCSPIEIDVEEDVSRLFYGIASDIGYDFVSHARYPDIDEKCNIMKGLNTPDNPPANALDAFARWFVDDHYGNAPCLNFNNEAVLEIYRDVAWNSISAMTGYRQSLWLQCTQLGQFATSGIGDGHPFGWRFDRGFFRKWCADVFDEALENFMDESIARTNVFYGGLDPKIFQVFFTHGEMDPRRSLGPSEDINPNSPVVVMSLQSFGRDFGSPSEADYAVLVSTKARARQLILEWIEASQVAPTECPPETTTVGPPGPAFD